MVTPWSRGRTTGRLSRRARGPDAARPAVHRHDANIAAVHGRRRHRSRHWAHDAAATAPGEGHDHMTEAVRAPEERFADLPDFPYAAVLAGGRRPAPRAPRRGRRAARRCSCTASRPGRTCGGTLIPPLRDAGFRCIAPDHAGFGRSDKPADARLVLLRPPHGAAGRPGRAARPARRDGRRARLGRADRAARRGRAAGADRPDRRDGHRPLHRPPADERRVDDVPRLRRAHGGPADRDARARRLPPRSRATR